MVLLVNLIGIEMVHLVLKMLKFVFRNSELFIVEFINGLIEFI